MSKLPDLIKLQSALTGAAHDHYRRAGLTHVDVPQIVGVTGACENIDTLFRVRSRVPVPLYFSQTGQLCLEQALEHFPGVYTIMHSGRDEETEDERHLRQFRLTEEEFDWSLVGGSAAYDEEQMYSALLEHAEAAVKAISKAAIETHADGLESAGRDAGGLYASLGLPFHRISYDDAVRLLNAHGDPVVWGQDLGARQEATVVNALNVGRFPRPTFIMRYPKEIKFFNIKVSAADDRVVLSADLIFPGAGEGTGAAVRENDGERLEKRLLGSTMYRLHLERGGTLADFGWYLDLVKSGRTRPHAGYGIGNERVMQYLLGGADIRDCSVLHHLARQTQDWTVRQTVAA